MNDLLLGLRPADDILELSNGDRIYCWDKRDDPDEVAVVLVFSAAGHPLVLSYGDPDCRLTDEAKIRATLSDEIWRRTYGLNPEPLPVEGMTLAASSGINPLFAAIAKIS